MIDTLRADHVVLFAYWTGNDYEGPEQVLVTPNPNTGDLPQSGNPLAEQGRPVHRERPVGPPGGPEGEGHIRALSP